MADVCGLPVTVIRNSSTVTPGQRLTMRDAGGGGFGEPANRPRAQVLADVEEGFVTPAVAREVYGVEVPSGHRASPQLPPRSSAITTTGM